jgi:hypothetical protein
LCRLCPAATDDRLSDEIIQSLSLRFDKFDDFELE